MDDIQPFQESGGGGPILLGSQVKCEPESSVKNESQMYKYEMEEESIEECDVECKPESSGRNELDMDNCQIKEESMEESDEASIPIEIKSEIDSDCATTSQNLEYIIKTKPKVSQFPCRECNYVAKRANTLKRHKESKHEGIRYPCLECYYAATTAGDLKKHMENKHEGIRYPCNDCDYAATRARDLKRHNKRKHATRQGKHT